MDQLSILILEDSATDADLIVLTLAEAGIKASFKKVEDEQEYVRALSDEPDLILADWTLSSFNPLRALELLKESGLDIPFIVVTPQIGEEAAVEAFWAGAYDLVMKDRLGRLGGAVRRAIEQKVTRLEKTRVEERLRESERRFRQIFNGLQDAIYILDLEGRILEVNDAACDTLGYSRNELIGMNEAHIEANEDTGVVPQRLKTIRERGSLVFETLHRRKNGALFDVEVHSRIFEYEGNPAILGIARNISERKRIQEELIESRQDLANLMDNIQGMVYSCLNDRERTATFVSQGCLPLTGYSSHELIENRVVSYSDLVHVDDRGYVWKEVQEAVKLARPYVLEYRIVTKGGDIKWVWEKGKGVFDKDGRLICLEGIISDITDKKKAKEETERLSAAVEQAGEAIVITDTDGSILYVNHAFEQVTGYSEKEALGQNPRILKSGKQDNAFYKNLWDTIKAGKTWNGRMVNRRKDGTLYTEEATISPILGPSGRPVNYLAVKRDITAQLELEERFNQAQKMESIGRLAGGIAHDFNNMLGVIIGQAELALDEVGQNERLRRGLLEIIKAGERSVNLTKQLLGFARKQTISPRVIDLNETVERMLKMLRRLIGEDISLEWQPSSGLWPVKMDPGQLDQILANLCVNSRDAIAKGGNITMTTANHSFDENFCKAHKGFTPGDYVCITVSDDGCGMDKSVLEHIFEPFFTTKPFGRGTGLGLATVYGIVEQNNGFIRVDSRPQEGSTFEIYIPRYAGPVTEQTEKSALPIQRGAGETILVVEDDPSLLLLICNLLKGLGYEVIAAPSGEPALALTESHPGPIHLLISDVVMPGMGGKELATKLTAARPETRVLFLSGYPTELIVGQGFLDGATPFLSKPFTPRALAVKVREVLDNHPHLTKENH